MQYQIIQPSRFLKNYIRDYCFMESGFFDADVIERVIPVEHVQIMFHYKNPFVVLSNNKSENQPKSILSGLSDNYFDVSTNGETGVVFVSFKPIGACHFFNFPLSEIENQSVDLSDVFHSEIKNVEEQLYLKNSIIDRVQVIEDFLIKHFSPIPDYDALLVQKGVEIIRNSRGQASAKYLSDSLFTSSKTLERKFSKYLGKTTKQLIKLTRFQYVLENFGQFKVDSLTELAYKSGYFDQSHFVHDFKSFTGYTPGEFCRRYPDFRI